MEYLNPFWTVAALVGAVFLYKTLNYGMRPKSYPPGEKALYPNPTFKFIKSCWYRSTNYTHPGKSASNAAEEFPPRISEMGQKM